MQGINNLLATKIKSNLALSINLNFQSLTRLLNPERLQKQVKSRHK